MTHVTCRLTAKNRDQLRNPMLPNRVWATFFLSDVDVGHFFFTKPSPTDQLTDPTQPNSSYQLAQDPLNPPTRQPSKL